MLLIVKPMLIIIDTIDYKLLLNGYKLYFFLLLLAVNSFIEPFFFS